MRRCTSRLSGLLLDGCFPFRQLYVSKSNVYASLTFPFDRIFSTCNTISCSHNEEQDDGAAVTDTVPTNGIYQTVEYVQMAILI